MTIRAQIVDGKPCLKCNGTSRFARNGKCVPCHRATKKKSAAKHRAKYKARYRDRYPQSTRVRRMLGIRRADYFNLCERQDWRCAICQTIPTKSLVVDHDHETGEFRALLCDACNRGLGFFRDNAEALKRAAQYVTGAL